MLTIHPPWPLSCQPLTWPTYLLGVTSALAITALAVSESPLTIAPRPCPHCRCIHIYVSTPHHASPTPTSCPGHIHVAVLLSPSPSMACTYHCHIHIPPCLSCQPLAQPASLPMLPLQSPSLTHKVPTSASLRSLPQPSSCTPPYLMCMPSPSLTTPSTSFSGMGPTRTRHVPSLLIISLISHTSGRQSMACSSSRPSPTSTPTTISSVSPMAASSHTTGSSMLTSTSSG